jgi:hypothetical protein
MSDWNDCIVILIDLVGVKELALIPVTSGK